MLDAPNAAILSADPPPVESGYDPKRLEEPARALARRQSVTEGRRFGRPPRLVLREAYRGLPEAYHELNEAARRGITVTPAAEWLLDNFYLIRAQQQQVREDLPWAFYRTLPKLDRGPYRGLPRVHELAHELAGLTDNAIDEDRLTRFVGAFEEGAPLLIGELWALPSTLRLVLLERLSGLAQRVVDDLGEQEAAAGWAARIAEAAAADPSGVVVTLAEMVERHAPLSAPFAVALATSLQTQGPGGAEAIEWLKQRLRARGLSLDEMMRREGQRQAHRQASVANAINALRWTDGADWALLVEGLSVVERVLRRDPAGVYAEMDFATRDRYRRRVEALARHAPATEVGVAERAVALAAAAPPEEPPAAESREGMVPGAPERFPLLSLHDHIGTYLVGREERVLEREVGYRPPLGARLRRGARRNAGVAYLLVFLPSFALLMLGAWGLAAEADAPAWAVALAVAAALLPAFDLALALTNWGFTRVLPPEPLPKMAFERGIPEDCRTFVVVPTLVTSPENARQQVQQLEVQALANPDPMLRFALLTDFTDAPEPAMPGDEATLAAAVEAVRALNRRHRDARGDKFFLLHRERRWNPQEGAYMGWERKRGKLEEFNRLLRDPAARAEPGAETSYVLVEGDVAQAAAGTAVRYVITLDADTQLPPRAATDLVRTAAHPLNRPRYNPRRQRVTAGYGVLQPRVGIRAEAGFRTPFAQLFSGNVGVDPYTTAVSDLYQDLFGVGIFTGKGLYDVDAFHAALGGVIPENAVLSHDLLEGAHARTALATDVLLFDDYPSHYAAFAKRLHRWVRGDWQILPWLLPVAPTAGGGWRRNPLGVLGRWQIFDNLRRSLTPPALLVFLALAWTVLPGPALLWTLLALGAIAFPIYAPFTSALLAHPRDAVWSSYLLGALSDAKQSTLQVGLSVAFLAHEAFLMVDAIVRTLWRMARGRRLLEWVTAHQAEQGGGDAPGIWLSPAWGVLVLAAVALVSPTALPLAVPFCLAWIAAPWIARWTGRPVERDTFEPSAEERARLRLTARRTWRYFDDFMTAADRFLPPDNYQENPHRGLARRTSPTNIGLGLLAVQTAVDFGYLAREEGLGRIEAALDTLEELPRHKGHFFNWYSTETGGVLHPRYVSTVDSGNLMGALLTLKQGLLETPRAPWPDPALFAGLRDTLGALEETLDRPRADPESIELVRETTDRFRAALDEPGGGASGDPAAEHFARVRALVSPAADLVEAADATEFRSEGDIRELRYWAAQPLSRLLAERAAFERLAPWLTASEGGDGAPEAVAGAKTLGGLRAAAQATAGGDGGSRAPVAVALGAAEAAEALVRRAERLAERAEALALAMDFRPLYDAKAGLFAIGLNADTGARDDSFYNLLASEARLASLLAIARAHVPPKHWFRLGRPTTTIGSRRVLLSWTGTMFEYLMPLLFTRTYEGSLLGEACASAVSVQRHYGRRRGHPWGVSESAVFELDLHLTYQYRAFGVPGLGLKRGLAEDDVIAPYATALALMVRPGSAVRNLARLRETGAYGPYGFYEAVDYTKKRLPPGQELAVIGAYMAHHQGMTLLAIQNLLADGVVQRRFHREPLVRSVEALLQEQAPKQIERVPLPDEMEEMDPVSPQTVTGASQRIGPERLTDPTPHGVLLSNGRLASLVTAAGAGYARYDGLAVTRWRPDRTREQDGPFLYVRDLDTGRAWCAGRQPVTDARPEEYEAWFHTARAEIRRVDDGVEVKTEVCVSPEDDVEVRRYTLTNRSDRPRWLELTSYAEVVLYPPEADLGHPAFSKLFVRTEHVREHHALLATRRSRSEHDRLLWLFHAVADERPELVDGPLQLETDRAQFIGRGRDLEDPAALTGPLSGTVGPVLDPIVSLRRRITLPPHARASVAFTTGVAETRDEAVRLADRYDHPAAAQRAFELAEVYGLVELQHLGLTGEQALLAQHLATGLRYGNPALRADETLLLRNRRAQPGLWAYGISGDLPVLLFRIGQTDEVPALRMLLRMHAYWRARGLEVDLVVMNEHPPSYADELQHGIQQEVEASPSHGLLDQRGGIFVRRRDALPEEDVTLLMTAARVVLDGRLPKLPTAPAQSGRSLSAFTEPVPEPVTESLPRLSGEPPALTAGVRPSPAPASASEPSELTFFNGYGGFAEDGSEYVIRLPAPDGTPATPLPWTNVVANARCGFTATERGGGYTWYRNSQQNKLTPWSNDPVLDPLGEGLYLRDEDDGAAWTLPPRDGAAYEVRHGWGYTVYHHERDGVEAEATLFVPEDDPIKIVRVRLTNRSGRPRALALYRYGRWVMDEQPRRSGPFIKVRTDLGTGALFARNPYNQTFGGYVAFADAVRLGVGEDDAREDVTFTADRTAFLGRGGDPDRPAAVRRGGDLDGTVGAGFDPCAAFRVPVTLAPGETAEVAFLLGQADGHDDARVLIERYRERDAIEAALDGVRAFWRQTLSAVQVETPSAVLDTLVNGWLLYQNLACRLWGRSAFYQSGGAYGFRDQIQDACALVYTRPDLLRNQLLLHAAHQFVEGDVLHWWHQEVGAGIRSRFSDDLLWLPYATARYLRTTGDASVLDERARFITGRLLEPGEDEAYINPETAAEDGTLFEHCCRALDRSLTKGPHGLPLMGSGDWNDGMNRVGNEGTGESVWLGFFLYHILDDFAPLCDERGETERAAAYRAHRAHLQHALNDAGWDGAWYRRAFYDDGTPLGSKQNRECRIDAIAQGWSVISGVAPDARAERALGSAEALLIDEDARLIRLLTPPFDTTEHDPGYIKGYVPGVRENGGQYTHGVLWLVRALAERGHGSRAAALLEMITPLSHGSTRARADRFKTEPYAVAADVYSVAPHVGRGGWTWYTGSAGWTYRVAVESILGLGVEGGRTLRLDPRIPREWDGYGLTLRHGAASYAVRVENPEGVQRGVVSIEVDGEPVAPEGGVARIPLEDDGREHRVRVVLGGEAG